MGRGCGIMVEVRLRDQNVTGLNAAVKRAFSYLIVSDVHA